MGSHRPSCIPFPPRYFCSFYSRARSSSILYIYASQDSCVFLRRQRPMNDRRKSQAIWVLHVAYYQSPLVGSQIGFSTEVSHPPFAMCSEPNFSSGLSATITTTIATTVIIKNIHIYTYINKRELQKTITYIYKWNWVAVQADDRYVYTFPSLILIIEHSSLFNEYYNSIFILLIIYKNYHL